MAGRGARPRHRAAPRRGVPGAPWCRCRGARRRGGGPRVGRDPGAAHHARWRPGARHGPGAWYRRCRAGNGRARRRLAEDRAGRRRWRARRDDHRRWPRRRRGCPRPGHGPHRRRARRVSTRGGAGPAVALRNDGTLCFVGGQRIAGATQVVRICCARSGALALAREGCTHVVDTGPRRARLRRDRGDRPRVRTPGCCSRCRSASRRAGPWRGARWPP